jgi:hypothetical protein
MSMTETFVAIAAMMIALLVALGTAVVIAAAFAGWRVCKRDWIAPQAVDNTRTRV